MVVSDSGPRGPRFDHQADGCLLWPRGGGGGYSLMKLLYMCHPVFKIGGFQS